MKTTEASPSEYQVAGSRYLYKQEPARSNRENEKPVRSEYQSAPTGTGQIYERRSGGTMSVEKNLTGAAQSPDDKADYLPQWVRILKDYFRAGERENRNL